MSLLSPLFLLGIATLAIPVLIHLIQRERKQVVQFPSLMFLQRIPYQSVRRRRIRHWHLLLLRALAMLLIILAFARPFLKQPAAVIAASGGARELVILLDRSYSMGYGDRFARAQAAARDALRTLAADDRATVILFGKDTEVGLRSSTDRARLDAIVADARVGFGSTRYAPPLKLAQSIFEQSPLPRREAILISDFQRAGWQATQDVHFPEGATLKTVPIGDASTANVSVSSIAFQRGDFSGQERITVTAALNSKGGSAHDVDATLELDGRGIQTVRAATKPNESTSVTFDQFTLSQPFTRGSVRISKDGLPQDDVFHFVLSPAQPVSILLVEGAGVSRDASFYLTRALGIGTSPSFRVTTTTVDRVSANDVNGQAVVILNNVSVPSGLAGRLKTFAEAGGGLLVVAGDRSAWPSDGGDVVAPLGPGVDRAGGPGREARLSSLDYAHPVFELFRVPRSGDFSTARFVRYRTVSAATTDSVLARFDDGAPALVERKVGRGRAMVWASTLDTTWNDLAIKPVYLPFVHRMVQHLGTYAQPAPWLTVGQVLEQPATGTNNLVALTPSGQRVPLTGAGSKLLELNEQGFYEIRASTDQGAHPTTVAANLELAESDLATLDPQELVAAVTGKAQGAASGQIATAQPLTPEEQERRQSIWWFLLVTGVGLLAAEAVLANLLSRETGSQMVR